MSNLVDKAMELQVMTCLYSLLNRANHDEYLQRMGKKEALKFLEENSKYADIIKSAIKRLEAIDNANPSEALETLKDMLIGNGCNDSINDYVDNLILPIKQALQRLESIDNANFSEALECLRQIGVIETYHRGDGTLLKDSIMFKPEYDTIKQALLKAQEPKKYLKWEDLEFEEARCQYSNVKLGNSNFQMTCYLYKGCMKKVWIRNEIISFELKDTEEDKQFFNDLHLERVE